MQSRRRLFPAGFVALLSAVGIAVLVSASAAQDSAPIATGTGLFDVACTTPGPFSHRAPDDPIVFPGQPGASHSHDFLGNRSTNASSTNASLRGHLTTCVRGAELDPGNFLIPRDLAGYWVPTLYDAGQPVKFVQGEAEYRIGERERNIQPFPPDLKVVAGNAKGAPEGFYRWQCPGGVATRGSLTVAPTCLTRELRLTVKFPDCSNGTSDSQDHKSHMAYSVRTPRPDGRPGSYYACPDSHPIAVPMLSLAFVYPTDGGPDIRLASGDVSTAHADFMNGWDQDHLQHLIDSCLNADRYCGKGGT